MAELIATGNTDLSTWPVDIRRFMRLHTNKRFLNDRLREIPGSLEFYGFADFTLFSSSMRIFDELSIVFR